MSYMTKKQLIGSRQAAERLGLPTSTFYKRVKDGAIPFTVKMPGKTAAYLFDPDVIDQIEQAEQQQEPGGECCETKCHRDEDDEVGAAVTQLQQADPDKAEEGRQKVENLRATVEKAFEGMADSASLIGPVLQAAAAASAAFTEAIERQGGTGKAAAAFTSASACFRKVSRLAASCTSSLMA